jgi:predicted kinase
VLLERRDPILLAIGGFSGSGKSTIASLVAPHLGPPPGARTLNSDRIRKRMHGAAAEERLPALAYRPEVSDEVYRRLRREAADVLAAGYAVVTDAVFDRPAERETIGDSAAAAGVPFHGIWLEVSEAALLERLAARRNDPSDATAEVLFAQLQRDCGTIPWHQIDAAGPPESVRDAVLAPLRPTS